MEKSAIILGGGVAGLIAARHLLDRKWRVTLLEAKERLGGRVHTVRNDKVLVELGAEFVHGENAALQQVIRRAGLTMHEVPDCNRVLGGGHLREVPLWDRIGELLHGIDPRSPDQSFADFLARERLAPADRELALGFVQGFNAADPAVVSAHALLRAEVSAERDAGSKQARLNEGYGALIAALEHDVRARGAEVRLDTTARRVAWKNRAVDVSVECAGSTEELRGAACVVTLPLGVLKTGAVQFEPSLARKREAIDGLPFGNALKLALVFRDVWWPNHDFGFVHSFADAFPTWWSDPRGPVLTGWAGGPKADALADRSLEELTAMGLDVLAKLFDERAGMLKQRLVAAHSYNWARDPHIGGAYSYIPVRGLDLPKLLAQPIDGALFFAGEATATDAQMGTMFGAVESGLRAGREVAGE